MFGKHARRDGACLGMSVVTITPVYLVGFHRPVFHVQIPNLNREVIAGHHVSPAVAELDVRYGGDDFREERPATGIFWLLKNLRKRHIFRQDTHFSNATKALYMQCNLKFVSGKTYCLQFLQFILCPHVCNF